MKNQVLRLGHSPDADDAFMFYALARGKIATPGLAFEHVLADIETLNRWAEEAKLEVTAISVHALAYVHTSYAALTHGGSFGRNYGPMIVTREVTSVDALIGKRIAVPGLRTSAFLALCLRLAQFEPVVVPFDCIMDTVQDGSVDAGLLIHEGQLTHQALGLHKVLDLGEWWQQETGLPLPLGVNIVRKDLGKELIERISQALRASILYALEHRQEALAYALDFGRGLEPALADRFIGMYVNDLTLDLGQEGQRAIKLLLQRGWERGIVPSVDRIEFVA